MAGKSTGRRSVGNWPLVVVAAGHQVCRGQTLQVWVDNAGSVEVYRKGYTRNCRLCTTLVKAMATVAAGIGCRLEVIKITRCTGTGATLADQLSKARFCAFKRTAEQEGWPLQVEPARIPAEKKKWLDRPFPCNRLGAAILEELGTSSKLAGYTPGYTWR